MENGLTFTETPSYIKSLKHWNVPNKSPFDVGVVVSFGYFLYPHLLDNLKYGAINMHPSLLPKYRGPAPIHHALLNGDRTTGVSVIEIDPLAFDTGRILLQKTFPIPENITFQPLATNLSEFGASCVVETLRNLPYLKQHATVQNDSQASKAPKVRFEHGILSLKESATEIFQKWQALGDSVGVSVAFRGKRVKLCKIEIPSEEMILKEQELLCGAFIFDTQIKALWLKCAQNSWLLVFSLQQEDRKIGDALDFVNGYRLRNNIAKFEPVGSLQTCENDTKKHHN
ncbi:hypothetical protein ABG067_003604 [Albugo candida]|uniref:Methionyl-tRNA formyltransferase, mitochondrial n=1 Tax=Albugo candida TaxID=65357 RepID=A0A024FXF4_9STRA|nr:unnamed protein product [Albugo candida]|eukprot:CCI11577.1 unnamed protein product [Albugo candida]